MGKMLYAVAAIAGCMAMAVIYAECFFRTCRDTRDGDGFHCSNCDSHTEHRFDSPINFCPICGAFIIRDRKM